MVDDAEWRRKVGVAEMSRLEDTRLEGATRPTRILRADEFVRLVARMPMRAFRFVAVAVMLIGGVCLAYVVGSLLRFLDPIRDWAVRYVALIVGSTAVVAFGSILWLLTEVVDCLKRKRE